MATLRKLKTMGVSIVMDDFGTGYSNLSYLWKFPFDKIKIDRSFMAALEQSDDGVETVVKSIIALGREMKMRVTVEGVETKRQVDFLYNAHADQVQGFYFGEPVPASEISADVLKNFRKSLVVGNPVGANVHLVKSVKG
jgi:EAL domain-containing protein (putative c-di-GMP-specific phosphodiesterase class I)